MKKIIIVLFLLPFGDIFAQAKWLPKSINLSIPGKGTLETWSECPGHIFDNTSDTNGVINLAFTSSWGLLSEYSRTGDSISIMWTYPIVGDCHLFGLKMSFTLDSLHQKLQNFVVSLSTLDYSNLACIISSFQFLSLNFTILEDSLLTISGGGIINSANYSYRFISNCLAQSTAHYGRNITLIKDSSSYSSPFITLVMEKPFNAVYNPNFERQELKFISYIHNNYIKFFFPSSPQPQLLSIYDILGREIKRIEIPSGISEYRLERGGLMSGYYFGRMGNMGAKFVVY